MTTFDVFEEVIRLYEIADGEKLTQSELDHLSTFFNNTKKLSSVEDVLIKSKDDKTKLSYLRKLLIPAVKEVVSKHSEVINNNEEVVNIIMKVMDKTLEILIRHNRNSSAISSQDNETDFSIFMEEDVYFTMSVQTLLKVKRRKNMSGLLGKDKGQELDYIHDLASKAQAIKEFWNDDLDVKSDGPFWTEMVNAAAKEDHKL
ncbi:6254_t:CDS:2 [Cetraspora pellucida]|uniref:6254_t:CDS:1 n=1 Tax=Cetraspora pellucida TaxID=1433469 RepID=A0A9N9NGP6_9GLOM|nr:6254_t:CDS:2 [Cetraspora pellucida]